MVAIFPSRERVCAFARRHGVSPSGPAGDFDDADVESFMRRFAGMRAMSKIQEAEASEVGCTSRTVNSCVTRFVRLCVVHYLLTSVKYVCDKMRELATPHPSTSFSISHRFFRKFPV